MTLSLRLELLLGLSLVLSFFSWGRRVLFPFQIFTTWIHECCHAVTALLLGGSSIRITISPDGSGLTHYQITSGKIRQAIIASAGYLGASVCGCFIFLLAVGTEKLPHYWNVHSMVIFLCVLIGLSLLIWIRNAFGFFSTLILGGAIFALNYSPLDHYANEVLLFISIQTALNALFDIRMLLGLNSSKKNTSDAHILQKIFYLPHWFWAITWLSISMLMMYGTLRLVI